MLEININHNLSEPLFQQIVEQIKQLIDEGRLQAGEQIPSVRDLARLLQLNPSTVARAYFDLKQEGLVVTSRRRGTIIIGNNYLNQVTTVDNRSVKNRILDSMTAGSHFQDMETVFTLHPAQWRVQRSV
jgi:DNA-binding transcriptional regulator YhcF (GntR family)